MEKRAWYLSPWLICFMFAAWAFIFPAIVGFVLLIKYYQFEAKQKQNYKMIDDARAFVENAKARQSEISEKVENEEKALSDAMEKSKIYSDKIKLELSALKKEISFYQSELVIAASLISVDENISSEEYKNELALLKLKQSELIKSDSAVAIFKEQDKKKSANSIKQLLRCFNAESEIIISNVSIKNVDACRSKMSKTYEALNKIFALDGVALDPLLLSMKLEELNLIYSYKFRQEQEREEQRAIKEQMLEEEKVRREIEAEKTKIEKEEIQFKNEVNKLISYMAKSTNDIEKQLYVDKIRELEEKLKLLEKDKENVLQREQNTRAGFVYIISNIGSFGENVYKIGMTRRLEPMDRVKELGDASVPFEFDVHAMIFSEDAPSLETVLHNTFKENQINKVNTRKEFFRVGLTQIEQVVKSTHNATVEFTQFAKAEQYRASLEMV